MTKSLPFSKAYRRRHLGPIVLVTRAGHGRADVSAMGVPLMIDFEPPLVGCVISNRNHTFSLVKASKECVINIPTVELAAQVVGCGNKSGRRVDKFKTFGLTPVPGSLVKAPLILECYANFECKVVDTKLLAKYSLFILEVLKAWIDPSKKNPRTMHHRGKGTFMVAGRTITLPSRMK